MAAESRWYTQKPAAAQYLRETLADGQEKPLSVLVDGLQETVGVSSKNALKAIGIEVSNGTAVLNGSWKDGSVRKGGA